MGTLSGLIRDYDRPPKGVDMLVLGALSFLMSQKSVPCACSSKTPKIPKRWVYSYHIFVTVYRRFWYCICTNSSYPEISTLKKYFGGPVELGRQQTLVAENRRTAYKVATEQKIKPLLPFFDNRHSILVQPIPCRLVVMIEKWTQQLKRYNSYCNHFL